MPCFFFFFFLSFWRWFSAGCESWHGCHSKYQRVKSRWVGPVWGGSKFRDWCPYVALRVTLPEYHGDLILYHEHVTYLLCTVLSKYPGGLHVFVTEESCHELFVRRVEFVKKPADKTWSELQEERTQTIVGMLHVPLWHLSPKTPTNPLSSCLSRFIHYADRAHIFRTGCKVTLEMFF